MARVELAPPASAVAEEPARWRSRLWIAFLGAVAAVCVLLWLPAIRSSLSIDEAGTFWVIKDGVAKALRRSLDFQGQSPVYYLVDWIALKLGGRSELALRIPSLIAMLLAIIPVFRMAERLFDRETAFFAAVAFAGTTSVAFAAGDARPYALALLFSAAATLKLLRWLDSGSGKDRAWYVLFAVLTIYVHYLYAIALVAHAIYAVARKKASPRRLLLTASAIAVACLPLAPQLLALLRRSASLAWTGAPTIPNLVLAARAPVLIFASGVAFVAARRHGARALPWIVAPFAFLFLTASTTGVRILRLPVVHDVGRAARSFPVAASLVVLAVAAAGFVLIKRHWGRLNPLGELRPDRDALTLVLAYALAAPAGTFLVTASTDMEIFAPRYFFSATPGVVLLAAWMFRKIGPRALKIAAAGCVLIAAAGSVGAHHSPDDWQAATRTVNASVVSADEPILVSAGFVEANQVSWLTDPTRVGFILAPLAFYPERGRVIPMPFDPVHQAAPYVAAVAAKMQAPEFLVVTNKLHLLPDLLERALAPRGYRATVVGRHGWLRVTKFSRA